MPGSSSLRPFLCEDFRNVLAYRRTCTGDTNRLRSLGASYPQHTSGYTVLREPEAGLDGRHVHEL